PSGGILFEHYLFLYTKGRRSAARRYFWYDFLPKQYASLTFRCPICYNKNTLRRRGEAAAMSEAKGMGSLADRLLSFVSTTPERDANYDIAVTLLKHYPQLKGMTLGQIADLCYTSKASISRFCRFMGMNSFKEFQIWLEQDFTMRTDYSRQFYTMLHNNQEMAIGSYRDTLIGNIYATITPENAE